MGKNKKLYEILIGKIFGIQREQQNGRGETRQVHDRAIVLPRPEADYRWAWYVAATHHQDRAGQAVL